MLTLILSALLSLPTVPADFVLVHNHTFQCDLPDGCYGRDMATNEVLEFRYRDTITPGTDHIRPIRLGWSGCIDGDRRVRRPLFAQPAVRTSPLLLATSAAAGYFSR